ncbi:MAG TPA: F0F1 ATP synthase subunit delta [Gallionellaceae bacterium]|nr:F0F1 ATP synthase subunit delta [Gallionellaceae bacterium]
MSQAITVARPYAQAAFDEAQKLGELKAWSEMLHAAAEAVAQQDMQSIIRSTRVTAAQLNNVMLAVCGGKLNATAHNFIKLLIENKRLDVLPEILEMFEILRAEAEKSVDVVVTSAFDLNDAQKQKIAAALKVRMGREIKLSCETNRDLLGGVVIRAGDKVIDGSARTRLSELAVALA